MGAYLDKPITDKVSDSCQLSDGSCYGYSSMQGWRTSQEDAHTCAPNFDPEHQDRHLFGVFDGHGGPEVAKFVSEQLASFLLQTEAYQAGEFEQALSDCFLGLDAKVIEPEVAKLLRSMAKSDSDDEDEEDSVAKEAAALQKDAEMPLNRLLKTIGAPALRAAMAMAGDEEEDDDEETDEEDKEEAEAGEKEKAEDEGESGVKNEGTAEEVKEEKPKPAKEAEASAGTSGGAASASMENENNENIEKERNGQSSSTAPAEEDEEDDKDYKPGDEVQDDEKEEGDEEEEDDDEEDDDDGDESDSEEESEEDYQVIMPAGDDPGVDSGTTAVVALVIGDRLFVANAGDSRAVLSDGGKAVDLSVDHKPEDEPERQRIESAGGHVTKDGRVNGGLNLSRALGDHAYKQNGELTAAKQIISPVPEVRTVTLTDRHRFLLLACDGIWNSMSSQEAVDFCEKRLSAGLSPEQVCECLFDHCLAPDAADSDGTGCDNMTAVLVCFKCSGVAIGAKKRSADNSEQKGEGDNANAAKKAKLEA